MTKDAILPTRPLGLGHEHEHEHEHRILRAAAGGYLLATWLAGRDAGIAASALWLWSVPRRLGIGFRFAPVTA